MACTDSGIFFEVELFGEKGNIKITGRRTRIDRAHFIKGVLEERYADTWIIVLVMGNLTAHNAASLYTVFSSREPGT